MVRESYRFVEGHRFDSRRVLRGNSDFFLFPTMVKCWILHLSARSFASFPAVAFSVTALVICVGAAIVFRLGSIALLFVLLFSTRVASQSRDTLPELLHRPYLSHQLLKKLVWTQTPDVRDRGETSHLAHLKRHWPIIYINLFFIYFLPVFFRLCTKSKQFKMFAVQLHLKMVSV